MHVTARITTGQPMPGCSEDRPPAGVVLLQGEDTVDTMVKPALVAAGADLDRIVVYDPKKFTGQPFALPDDLKLVEEAAADVQAKLLVIDPVLVFFSCNANSDQSVRKPAEAVGRVCGKPGASGAPGPPPEQEERRELVVSGWWEIG